MEQVPPDTKARTPSSRVLEDLLDQAPADYFTLGWLMSTLHQRSFGIVILFLGLLATAPIGSTVPGLVLAVVAKGMIGTAVGIGASVSGVLTGSVADLSGSTVAFLMLAAAGGVGLTSVWVLMPETRDLAMKPTTCRPMGR